MEKATAHYQAIPGVISATVGYIAEGTVGTAATPIQIRAVDSNTFAHTGIWTPQDSSQTLTSLMSALAIQRSAAISVNEVPVIVDANTMNSLALQIGDGFTVSVNGLLYSTLNCRIIAVVEHIPTINNTRDLASVGDYTPPGGILLDYTTYNAVYNLDFQNYILGDQTSHHKGP